MPDDALIHDVPPGTCPSCGHTHDKASLAAHIPTDVSAPRPGDLSVCASCFAINVFLDDGGLRTATDDEAAAVPAWVRAFLKWRDEVKH